MRFRLSSGCAGASHLRLRFHVNGRIPLRDALKFGPTAAASAALSPLLARTMETRAMEPDQPLPSIPENMHMSSASDSDICFLPARQMADFIRQKKLSAREVMQAHLKQIERVNPKVNAIVTLVPEEQLMAQALAADEATAKGNIKGPLHGLPVGVKDLHPTKAIRTTFGSPLHEDDIPNFDCLVVEREKNAGAIVIGKTNVPEWGLGSQTFNPVFGPTLNPYDLTKTCCGETRGGWEFEGRPGRYVQRYGAALGTGSEARRASAAQSIREPRLHRRGSRARLFRCQRMFCRVAPLVR